VTTNIAAIAAIFGKSAEAAESEDALMTSIKRIIAYINNAGGIAGRKIEPVFFEGKVSDDANTNGQAACSALTEDTKVDIVVLPQAALGDAGASCFRNRGVSIIDTANWASDAVAMNGHPNWFPASAMGVDRSARAEIEISAQRGVLKRGDVLGVLVEDCPWAQRVMDGTVLPAAKKVGVSVVQGTFKCVENLVTDLGPVANDVQREALRFRTAGVTHVIVLSAAEAFVVSQFTTNASKQQYYPKYIVSSIAYPWQNSQGDCVVCISPDAQPNMTGLGSFPLFDVGPLARPENGDQAAAQARCNKADPDQAGAASDTSNGRFFARLGFYLVCDTFFVTKALLEANGVRFSIADVTRGYRAALNGTFASSTLNGGYFNAGSNRFDGAGFVRPFAYDPKNTFAYVGPAVRVP
jgi:hypothetical protein